MSYRTQGERDTYVEVEEMSEDERIYRLVRFGIGWGAACILGIAAVCVSSGMYETYAREHRPVVVPTTPLDDCIAHGGTYDARWSRCDPPKEAK